MKLIEGNFLINFVSVFILVYLFYHFFNGKYNIQNYLVHQFEEKYFQAKRQDLKFKIRSLDMDLLAIYNKGSDIIDEIQKRNNPTPREDEIVYKLD